MSNVITHLWTKLVGMDTAVGQDREILCTNGRLLVDSNVSGITAPISSWQMSDYPAGATPLAATSGNKANAVATATLTPASGKTAYIQGFIISASGALAALAVQATVAGLIGGVTGTFIYGATAGVLTMGDAYVVPFPKAIPASAVDVPIVVNLPALGLGNTNAAVFAFGYQI